MRSSLQSIRRADRLCDACRQQRHRPATASFQLNRASSSRFTALQAQTRKAQPSTSHRAFSSTSRLRQQQQSSSRDDRAAPSDARPAVPQTHYDLFPKTLPAGPPPASPFAIDVRALRREFLALQAGAHPDMHAAHLKLRAEATSARINEAFRTLEDPLRRAQYVLELRGLDVANDETAKVEDPELLMLVLETREAIEEAEEESDLDGLKGENEGRIRESVARLEEMFREDDLEEAKAETVKLRYWMNIRESINNWEKGKPVVLEH
ncbi:Co-chaperone Hsc20 [Xylariaceae sp. FL0016]|nr:Co-chaperone Hsc20 [Xylariaceae sp. FL0016]